jgi:hypothetical protein
LQRKKKQVKKKENQAQDKDIRKGSMTNQDEGRIEVTIYEDDIVVRGPRVMKIIVCLIVVVMERPR